MNTTMADSASERLDAQIADALFGQPGMSKMDVANRLRHLRGAGAPLFCGSCYGLGVIGYTSGQTPEQFEQGEYPCPDCAQPSPAGQVDALPPLPKARVIGAGRHAPIKLHYGYTAEQMQNYAQAALAARQPVGATDKDSLTVGGGQAADTEIDAQLNALYREMVASGQHNGGMSGVAWDRAVYRMAARQPAQAVDLPYSLDADPAGIRARVCDVITGALMVGAQGHTPPPAGHWAEPFWKSARADAAAQAVELGQPLQLNRYDTGLLGDGGSGDVAWWQDYVRAELDRAHDFYQDQADSWAVGK